MKAKIYHDDWGGFIRLSEAGIVFNRDKAYLRGSEFKEELVGTEREVNIEYQCWFETSPGESNKGWTKATGRTIEELIADGEAEINNVVEIRKMKAKREKREFNQEAEYERLRKCLKQESIVPIFYLVD